MSSRKPHPSTPVEVDSPDAAGSPDAVASPDAEATPGLLAVVAARAGQLTQRAVTAWGTCVSRVVDSVLGRWWTRTERPGLVDWAILGALLAMAFGVFLYGDVRATFEHSFNFLDALTSGRLRDFYSISIENSSTGHPAVYDIPLYLLFGLWNLPTYVIHRVTGFDYLNSTPAELWLKAMIVVCALLAAKVLAALARDLGVGRERSRWVAFFFLSSMSVFVPVFVIVQYDIVLVLVVLLAMRSYCRGSLRGFLGWFILANTLKLFAVFIFIPLVLLREKRLRVAAVQLVTGLLGLAACRLLYHGDAGYAAATGGFTEGMLKRLTSTSLAWLSEDFAFDLPVIPVFVVFMVGVAIFAYVVRPESQRHLSLLAVYIGLAVFLVFVAIVPLNPYWIVLVAPFAVLVIFLNPRFLLLNTLLETGITAGLLVVYILVGYSMYDRNLFTQLLLPHVVEGASSPRFGTAKDVLIAVGLGQGLSFVIGFIMACVLAVLIVNYPRREMVQARGNEERMPRSVVWLRLVMQAFFSALLLAIYFVPAVPVAYSTASQTAVSGAANILEPGATVSETLTPQSTMEVTSVGVGFLASGVQWIDSSQVHVVITDSQGGEVFSAVSPANALGDGVFEFPSAGLVLTAGEQYVLTISSTDVEGGMAYVQINPDVDLNVTTESGTVVAGDLVLVLSGTTR